MADKARSEMHRKKTMAYANKSKNIVLWGDAEEKPRARRLLVYGEAFEQDKSLLKMSSRCTGVWVGGILLWWYLSGNVLCTRRRW